MELSMKPGITSNGVVLGFAHCFTDLLRELTKKTSISQRKRMQVAPEDLRISGEFFRTMACEEGRYVL